MKGRVKKYIAIGTPQRGVGKIPLCFTGIVCYGLQKISSFLIYSSIIQNHVGPAGYYVDVFDKESYLKGSNFLPELNNEVTINEKYKERFSQLDKVVLMKFNSDTILYPREGAWFEFIDEQNNLIPLNQSDFYIKDNIGLRKLMNENKVIFAESAGNHSTLTEGTMECYWDANGNLSQIIGCKSNKARLHDWDEENRLRFVLGEKYAGYYGYDAKGERVYKLTGTSGIEQVNAGYSYSMPSLIMVLRFRRN